MKDHELTHYDDLDDKLGTIIDKESIVDEKFYYGDHDIITSKTNQTARYDLKKDKAIWETVDSGFSSQNVLQDGYYYINLIDSLIAYSIKTGEMEKEYSYDGERSGNTIQLLDDEIVAFDKATGNEKTKVQIDDLVYDKAFPVKDSVLTFSDEDTMGYGVVAQMHDPETLELIKSIDLESALNNPLITKDTLYYEIAIEAIVAVDTSLDQENWRSDIEQNEYTVKEKVADENGIHMMLVGKSGISPSYYLQLDQKDCSVVLFVELEGVYHGNEDEFYVKDGKAYIKITEDGGKVVFYIFDKDDVNRPFTEA